MFVQADKALSKLCGCAVSYLSLRCSHIYDKYQTAYMYTSTKRFGVTVTVYALNKLRVITMYLEVEV